MPIQYIYVICKPCGGDGKNPQSTVDENGNPVNAGEKDCDTCNGLGKYLWGYLQDELEGVE
jgi:DnaJ-class molecular chaperone